MSKTQCKMRRISERQSRLCQRVRLRVLLLQYSKGVNNRKYLFVEGQRLEQKMCCLSFLEVLKGSFVWPKTSFKIAGSCFFGFFAIIPVYLTSTNYLSYPLPERCSNKTKKKTTFIITSVMCWRFHSSQDLVIVFAENGTNGSKAKIHEQCYCFAD